MSPEAAPPPRPTLLADSWSPEALARGGWRGGLQATWRVATTCAHGVRDNHLPQQAAALTYYTLMSLGPILALAITVSGFILSKADKNAENPAKAALVKVIEYIVPAASVKASVPGGGATHKLSDINPEVDAFVTRLLANAASGQAGVIGLTIIFVLAVLMLSRVEDALNGIWGVRYGRSWRDRFANYLLFLVLFFLIGATTITMLSLSAFAESLGKTTTWLGGWLAGVPGHERILGFISGSGPFFASVGLLALAFAVFNRMMPNVRVRWSAAFVGGIAIALLVTANHQLAALYVGKVTQFQDLYGGLSIILVLMFGTYLSWLFVLIGGQVAYAYQHRRALARHKSWENLSHRARRTLAFVCVAETLRRYRGGLAGPRAEDIAAVARISGTVADGCLQMLRDAGLLALESRTEGHRPARPLEEMTIGQLWSIVDLRSDGEAGEPDLRSDPAAQELARIEQRLMETSESKLTLGELAARA
ncbi:MAG: YihY/virulence factor BrkB family protein [Opitutia bacterium]